MKRSFFIILLASIINTSGLCQENSFKGPIIYVEAAGSGFSTYNLNVEHLIITRSKWGVNARLGYGYLKAGGTIDQDIVAGVNVYYGNKKSHPEIGLYLTYANHNYVEKHIAKAIYFAPNLSYRFQKPTRGLFIRISYVPVFKVKDYTGPNLWVRVGDFHQTFGLAVGYYFGKGKKMDQN